MIDPFNKMSGIYELYEKLNELIKQREADGKIKIKNIDATYKDPLENWTVTYTTNGIERSFKTTQHQLIVGLFTDILDELGHPKPKCERDIYAIMMERINKEHLFEDLTTLCERYNIPNGEFQIIHIYQYSCWPMPLRGIRFVKCLHSNKSICFTGVEKEDVSKEITRFLDKTYPLKKSPRA